MKEYVGWIYKWTNKINGKVYIGQTMNKNGYKERWNQHIYNARYVSESNKNYFYRAIRKYGSEGFDKEILESVKSDSKSGLKEKLDKLEIYYIEKFDSFNNGYNSTLGGEFNIFNSGDESDIEKAKMKVLETRSRNELLESFYKVGINSRLPKAPNDINKLKEKYYECDILHSKYRYRFKYKTKNRGRQSSKDRDYYTLGDNHKYTKIYRLDDIDLNMVEKLLDTKYKCELGEIDFFDVNNVKAVLQLDVEDLKYEYDLETIIVIKDFLNKVVDKTPLTDKQKNVLNLWRQNKTQIEIGEILEISNSTVSRTIGTIVKNIINEYERQYEDWYYLNIRKGEYKKCSKCGEIKLVSRFDKNGSKGYRSSCKECR